MSKVIRAKSGIRKYTRSPAQKKRMDSFKACANWWTVNRTVTIFHAWSKFSNDRESPYNAFLRVNIIRVFNDLPVTPTPPPE